MKPISKTKRYLDLFPYSRRNELQTDMLVGSSLLCQNSLIEEMIFDRNED